MEYWTPYQMTISIYGTLRFFHQVRTGVWSDPLPVETTSVGEVVSATSGIGMIFTGIGELRGEG
jgi:propanediol dehydratase large subunit